MPKDLGLSEQSLYQWARQSDIDTRAETNRPLTTTEREELTKLRRELKKVEQECDSLKNGSVLCERKAVKFAVVRLHR